jgi:hypothetical protein
VAFARWRRFWENCHWQSFKTKKLEKDLQTMREEMRQQQLKRLNNQLSDK